MPNNVTVTAKLGPAQQATAMLYNDVTDVNIQLGNQVLRISHGGTITDFDLFGVATVTYTIASHIATIAFS